VGRGRLFENFSFKLDFSGEDERDYRKKDLNRKIEINIVTKYK